MNYLQMEFNAPMYIIHLFLIFNIPKECRRLTNITGVGTRICIRDSGVVASENRSKKRKTMKEICLKSNLRLLTNKT